MFTTNIYEIPLKPENQTFRINLNGIDYTFTLRWNYRAAHWILNIGDTFDNPLINGIPLVIGVNLLAGYKSFAIGGIGTNLFIRSIAENYTTNYLPRDPAFADLGTNTRLYFGVNVPDNQIFIPGQFDFRPLPIPPAGVTFTRFILFDECCHLFVSEDFGETWRQIDSPDGTMQDGWNAMTMALNDDDYITISGQDARGAGGFITISTVEGFTAATLIKPPQDGDMGLAITGNGQTIVSAGFPAHLSRDKGINWTGFNPNLPPISTGVVPGHFNQEVSGPWGHQQARLFCPTIGAGLPTPIQRMTVSLWVCSSNFATFSSQSPVFYHPGAAQSFLGFHFISNVYNQNPPYPSNLAAVYVYAFNGDTTSPPVQIIGDYTGSGDYVLSGAVHYYDQMDSSYNRWIGQGLTHFLVSIDFLAQTIVAYANDQLLTTHAGGDWHNAVAPNATSFAELEYYSTDQLVSGFVGTADLWVSSQALNINDVNVRRQFINADYTAVPLASDGHITVGGGSVRPEIFLHATPSGVPNDFLINNGSGPPWANPQPKFGLGSGNFFDGGSVLSAGGATSDWWLGTSQFTIEAWVYTVAYINAAFPVIQQWNGQSGLATDRSYIFGFGINGTLNFSYSTTGSDTINVTSTYNLPRFHWVHIAVDRDISNVVRLYANGVVVGSATVSAAIHNSIQLTLLGGDWNSSQFPGLIDEFRVSIGVARYAGAFTPPTAPFTSDAPFTRLLVHCDGPEASLTFVDSSSYGHAITNLNLHALISTGVLYFNTEPGVCVRSIAPNFHYWINPTFSQNSSIAYIWDDNDRVMWKSLDNLVTWSELVNSGSPGNLVNPRLRCSKDGRIIVVGDIFRGYLRVSIDGGTTWTDTDFQAIVDPSFDKNVYNFDFGMSIDGSVLLTCVNAYDHVAANYLGLAWTSIDYGITWTLRPLPIIADGISGALSQGALVCNVSPDGQYMLVGYDCGPHGQAAISIDRGNTWIPRDFPMDNSKSGAGFWVDAWVVTGVPALVEQVPSINARGIGDAQAYAPYGRAVQLGGTNIYHLGVPTGGVVDSGLGLLSVWLVYYSAISGNPGDLLNIQPVNTSSGPITLISIYPYNRQMTIQLEGRIGGSNAIFQATATGTFDLSTWRHIAISWNTNLPAGQKILQVYVNGVQLTLSDIHDVYGPFLVNYSTSILEYSFFESHLYNGRGYGEIYDFWFAPGQYLDLSIPANIQRFRTVEGFAPGLGSNGEYPTAISPAFFFHKDNFEFVDPYVFPINQGTGGTVAYYATSAAFSISENSPQAVAGYPLPPWGIAFGVSTVTGIGFASSDFGAGTARGTDTVIGAGSSDTRRAGSAAGHGTATGANADPKSPGTASALGRAVGIAAPGAILLCHFDGTSGSTIFTDPVGVHTLTPTSATVTTSAIRFGTGAGNFTANTAARIVLDRPASFNIGSQQFTIDAWVYFTSVPSGGSVYGILTQFGGSNNLGWFFGWRTGQLSLTYSTSGIDNPQVGATFTPALNTWYHVAIDRDASNVIRVYVNGVVIASATVTSAFFASTQNVVIGNDNNNVRAFPGYIDEIRMVLGQATYAGAFTPPIYQYFTDSVAQGLGTAIGIGPPVIIPTLDGTATGTNTANTFVSAVLTTTSPNDVICALVYIGHNAPTGRHWFTGISGGSLTWQKRTRSVLFPDQNGTNGQVLELWWAIAPTALSAVTITATANSAYDSASILVFGVNGCNLPDPWDPNPSLAARINGITSVPIFNNMSTSFGGCFSIFGFGTIASQGIGTVPAGFTAIGNVPSTAASVGAASMGSLNPQTNQNFAWGNALSGSYTAIFDVLTSSSAGVSAQPLPNFEIITNRIASATNTVSFSTASISDGNVLVIISYCEQTAPAPAITGISGGFLNWTLRSRSHSSTRGSLEIWYTQLTGPLPITTITVTYAGNFDDLSLEALSIVGCGPTIWDTNGSLPAMASNLTLGTWTPSVTVSTSTPNTLMLATTGTASNTTGTAIPPIGYTLIGNVQNGGAVQWSYMGVGSQPRKSLQTSVTVTWGAAIPDGTHGGEYIVDALTAGP